MTDPWGSEQPPAQTGPTAPLPPRLARLAEVQATGIALTAEDPYAQEIAAAHELPEVQMLMRDGWRALDGAPLYCLLPAAWPAGHRTWVPDRLPKLRGGATTDSYWSAIVPLPLDEDRPDDYAREQASVVGLLEPPTGRIWLLRSPWPRVPVAVIYEIIWIVVERGADRDEIAQVYRVARDVLTWDEERALNVCPAATRDLLDAWAQAGRVGEAAATMIEQRVQPADLDDALRRTGLDEQGLLDWLTSLQTDLDDEAISFINAWRSAGLPGNPPSGAIRFVDRDPAELQPGSMRASISTPRPNSNSPGSTPPSAGATRASAKPTPMNCSAPIRRSAPIRHAPSTVPARRGSTAARGSTTVSPRPKPRTGQQSA